MRGLADRWTQIDSVSAQNGLSAGRNRPESSLRFFVIDLGTLGGTESFAYALNDLGQVAGSSRVAGDGTNHAFLFRNGSMTDLSPLNSQEIQTVGPTGINNAGEVASGVISSGVYVPAVLNTEDSSLTLLGSLGGVTSFGFNGVATAINRWGHAVGYSYLNDVNRHAFLYSDSGLVDIGSLGGDSFALAINDHDVVVGASAKSNAEPARAFKFAQGVMKAIGPATESYAHGVNNWSQVVGTFFNPDDSAFHAFLYGAGVFSDLGDGNSPQTDALAINDWGQIVGSFLRPFQAVCSGVPCIRYEQRAFIHDRHRIVDLTDLIPKHSGWQLAWAFDINNVGQITGYGVLDGKFRAFLLTPAISKSQCKNGGWKQFGFKNQGRCIEFVHK